MIDPFARALAALYASPLAASATYAVSGGAPVSLRVIRGQPDTISSFGRGKVAQSTNTVSILRRDVDRPVGGAIVTVYADPQRQQVVATLRLVGAPLLDDEGLSWSCGSEPA